MSSPRRSPRLAQKSIETHPMRELFVGRRRLNTAGAPQEQRCGSKTMIFCMMGLWLSFASVIVYAATEGNGLRSPFSWELADMSAVWN